MKKIVSILLFGITSMATAQQYVINEQLLIQITANQGVRMASAQLFKNNFEEQNEYYEEINTNAASVLLVYQHILNQLKNINSAIRQSKQLVYIYHYLEKITENSGELLELTADRPEYAILLTRYYEDIFTQSLRLKNKIENEILREDEDFLMDAYDRGVLIQNVLTQLRLINGSILYLNMKLKNVKNIPYLQNIQAINNYVCLDKMVIRDIINRWNWMGGAWAEFQ